MVKKKKASKSWSVSSPSERHYVVYYAEIDNETDDEIKREEKGRYSDYLQAFNFLAGHYHNHPWVPVTTFDDKTGTIIQKTERKPDITYKWYIEDEWE